MAFDRIEAFLGRSDNMVKLRGINLFPHAVGAIIENPLEHRASKRRPGLQRCCGRGRVWRWALNL